MIYLITAYLSTSEALHCHLPFCAWALTFSALTLPSTINLSNLARPPTNFSLNRKPNVLSFISRRIVSNLASASLYGTGHLIG